MIYSYVVDENNSNPHFPFVSEGAGHVFGVSAEAIMTNPLSLIGVIKDEDLASFVESVSESWRHLTEWNWTGRFQCPESREGWKWFKCNSMPKRLPNEHTVWYGAAFDVDAHVRLAASEEKLNASVLEKKMLQVRRSECWHSVGIVLALCWHSVGNSAPRSIAAHTPCCTSRPTHA